MVKSVKVAKMNNTFIVTINTIDDYAAFAVLSETLCILYKLDDLDLEHEYPIVIPKFLPHDNFLRSTHQDRNYINIVYTEKQDFELIYSEENYV